MSASWLRRAASRPLSLLLQAAGRAYVPGWTLADALQLAERLAADGQACTLGYFNAAHDTVAAVAAECAAIVDAAAQLSPPGYLSLKAPAFGFDLPAMAPLLARARERAMRVHFDSHDIASADATLHCVEQAVAQGNATGLTLPARWPRSQADAERAIALGLRVRLVKGEWPDPAAPGADPRAGLLALAGRLAGRAAEVAVATHDPLLARQALLRLQAAATRCELELLNGLPRRAVLEVARELGVPVRVYIPYGIPWRPYALRRLGENPRIAWWLLHDAAAGLRQHWRRR